MKKGGRGGGRGGGRRTEEGRGGMEGWYKVDNEEYNRSSQVILNHIEAVCVHY